MKGAFKGDDFICAVLVQGAVFPRELDRAFVSLRAGVSEEHVVEATQVGERLCQLQAGVVVIGRARRDQALGLRRNCLCQYRRRVAEAVHGPALNEIQITLSRVVPEIRTLAAHEGDRRAGGDLHQRVEGKRGVSHVEFSLQFCGTGWDGPKSKKAAPFGCGLLENLADLSDQRRRRTWRTLSSSRR